VAQDAEARESLAAAAPSGQRLHRDRRPMRPMQPAAPTRMHRDASRRNDDARRATDIGPNHVHQIQRDMKVPGHRSRTASGRPGARHAHAAPRQRVFTRSAIDDQMQTPPPLLDCPEVCRQDGESGARAAGSYRRVAVGQPP